MLLHHYGWNFRRNIVFRSASAADVHCHGRRCGGDYMDYRDLHIPISIYGLPNLVQHKSKMGHGISAGISEVGKNTGSQLSISALILVCLSP